jgi:hypothetical protein
MNPKRAERSDRPFGKVHGILALVATAGVVPAALADVQLTPRVGVSFSWIDNIDLAPDNPETEYLFRIDPGLRIEQSGARAESFLDYTMQNLFFMEDSDRDSTYHQLEAQTNLTLLQELLFLEGVASYSQQLIDPTRPTNVDNLFDVGNFTDAAIARVMPAIRRTFGRTRLDASYTRGIVDYEEDADLTGQAIEDANTEAAEFYFGSAEDEEEERLTWSLNADHERVGYEVSEDFAYDKAYAEVGVGLTQQLRIIGRYGQETDPLQSLSDGGLDEQYWETGVRWKSREIGVMQVMYGERFYGDSWDASWERDGRLLDFEITYVEEPTTSSHELGLSPLSLSPLSQSTLPETDDLGRLTTEVYLRKDFDARIALVGKLTEIAATAYSHERRYFESALNEKEQGAGLNFNRQIGARWTASLYVSRGEAELREGDSLEDSEGGFALLRKLSPTAEVRVSLDRIDREGGREEYTVNWATLGFKKDF